MLSRNERRAAAFEAIAHALLELAAVEREPDEAVPPREILIDHRNCEAELGLAARAFTAAAARGDFPAFRVSKRQTATKQDVLSWLKSRKVEPKPARVKEAPTATDPDAFLKEIHARFVARVGRAMTDEELDRADTCVLAGRHVTERFGNPYTDTADSVAARVQEKIGKEPDRHGRWRSLGLDPAALERDAEALRQRLSQEQPEMGWRDRVRAVYELWDRVTEPLEEARRAARTAARVKKKAEKASRGELGLKR